MKALPNQFDVGNPASGSGQSTPLGDLLRAVFAAFASERVNYAVLRNADGLPDYTSNDVDLLVAGGSVDAASRCLLEQAPRHGWTPVATLQKFEYCCHWLVHDNDSNRDFLQVDMLSMLHYRGFPFAEAGAGLAGRTPHVGGFLTVAPGFESAFAVAKELLAKGTLKESARGRVQRQASDDKSSFITAFSPVIGVGLREKLWQATQAGTRPAVDALASELKRAVTGRRRGFTHFFRYAFATCRHYLRPPLSCFAVLIGPDGSGKTSVADEVGRHLLNHPFKIVHRGKSNFGVLPPLKTFKNFVRRLLRRPPMVEQSPAPGAFHSGMIRPNSVLSSLIYIVYYALDAWFGRLLLRRWRGQCGLILFDRYYYDYYYQIGNRRAPRWYLHLFEVLVPKPDLVILLDRDPGDIFAKKPELSAEEIGLQQRLIRRLLTDRPASRIVDARSGMEHTVRQVEALIVDHLIRKPERRNGTM